MEPRVWHQHYDPNVPVSLEYPDLPTADFLQQTAEKYPDNTALIFGGMAPILGEQHSKISYRELNNMVDRFAAGLQQLGMKKGDRVSLYMPNCPQIVVAYYGTLRAGGIAVPSNPLYVAREIEHLLNDSGARFVVSLSLLYPNVQQVRANTKVEHVIVTNIKEHFPGFLKVLFTVAKERKTGHRVDISGDTNTVWFQDILTGAPQNPEPVAISPEDSAVLIYTGGTTGVPKGAQLTHRNIVANAIQASHWLSGVGTVEGEEVFLTALPLTHSYAMTVCMNLSVFFGHSQILIPNPRDFDHLLNSINIHKPSVFPGVPTLYARINNVPSGNYDFKSIKACISGAAGLPAEVQREFQQITQGKLVEGYGLSEASPLACANPLGGGGRIGTIGVPVPDTDVKIVDAGTEETTLEPGETGILCIQGPQIMKGYWNMPTETANALRTDDEGKVWLHTGDIAEMSEDGYLRIVDRKKDMILASGGFNVYPREIEDRLYEHPAVLEAAAIGIPVGGTNQRAKAFVVFRDGASATEEELIEWCRDGLAKYKVPKFIEFRSELPKTMVGKILRRELMDEEARQPPVSE
jgi:long-chain acyl-CoA synthetase